MQKSPVLGIIYNKFDEKIGPKPFLWYPSTIDEQTRNQVASDSMTLSFNHEIPLSLAIIPISKLGLKAYVKYGEYHDAERRGRTCDTTMCLIFREENDSIFYKYYEDFQHLFNEFSTKLLKAEEDKSDTEHLQELVKELHDLSVSMVKTLEEAEMMPSETSAFPSAADDGAITKKETLKFKVIVCGDPAVGKTSIVLRFTDKAFKRTYMPTLGTNITDKTIEYDDFKINFQIWDIAGQAKFQRFRNNFYSGASGHLLVFDLTQPGTLQNLYAWANDIKSVIGETAGIIIGNKCDLAERQVDEAMINQLSSDLGLRVVLTSALTGENVEEAFREFGLEIVEKSGIKQTNS